MVDIALSVGHLTRRLPVFRSAHGRCRAEAGFFARFAAFETTQPVRGPTPLCHDSRLPFTFRRRRGTPFETNFDAGDTGVGKWTKAA